MKVRRLDGDTIARRRMAAFQVERMTEHLLDGVEAVEQREILDYLAVTKAQEICNPVADDAAVNRPFRRLAAEHRNVLAIHHNAVRHKAEGTQDGGHLALDQIEHGSLAAMRSAEPQLVDWPADGPLDVVADKLRDCLDVTFGIGLVEGIDDGALDRLCHCNRLPARPHLIPVVLNLSYAHSHLSIRCGHTNHTYLLRFGTIEIR